MEMAVMSGGQDWTFAALQAALQGQEPYRGREGKALPLDRIDVALSVFQARVHEQGGNRSWLHVKELARALREVGELDPITVLPLGERFIVVDGHHRLEAYRAEGKPTVPVKVHKGTLAQALVLSAKGNSRDKLPMTKAGKMEAAWRMVCNVAELSKAETATAAGVSPRTVASMRAKRQELTKAGEDPAAMLWADALKFGREAGEFTEDDLEAQAEEWAERLRQHFGPKASQNPEAFARALEIYSPNLVVRLAGLWADEFEGAMEDDPDSEF